MHALFPPMNDILRGTQRQRAVARPGVSEGGSQVGVDPRDMCGGHLRREGVQPALGLPLKRVLAPDGLVGVHGAHVDDHVRALRYRNFGYERSIDSPDGFHQGQSCVHLRATYLYH